MQSLAGYTLGKTFHLNARSEVVAAVRSRDGRDVVLKGFRGDDAASVQRRARRELELLRKLEGPGIPGALELILGTGAPVLVLERVPGLSLYHWVRTALPSTQDFLDVFVALAQVVSRIHRARVIHRDIAPSNIVIEPSTLQVQLIDFELARLLGTVSVAEEGEQRHASSGMAGQLAYISPEATGRVDRGLDSRSDLYSLGATMYFALTGRPPFTAEDRLGMIHAHIARLAVPASELRPELPVVLSRIVTKLLQKSPEDRYQTARALQSDLAECQQQLRTTGAIQSDFALGSVDAPQRPIFSKQLYGRDAEIALLRQAYTRALCGSPTVIAISGGPGMGKSALIQELRTQLVDTGGYLAKGKFDSYRQDLPYAGIAQAFGSLAQQLLTESDARFARWRESLREALGAIAGALVGLVPDLGLVLGDVPPVPLLPAAETRARLTLALQRFVRALATSQHPLVLFLDDLQWADTASREVLRELLLENRGSALLLIVAYRDTELAPEHPLPALLRDLVDAGVRIDSVPIGPLGERACAEMLAQALGRTPDATRPLATCVGRKTANSPLLIQQFIDHMHDVELIRFEAPRGWIWDDTALAAANIPDGAVALLTAKIARLPAAAAAALELASCAGDEFDLNALVELSGRAPEELEPALFTLADEGLIAPSSRGFRFAHERIREAAQSLLSRAARSWVHAEAARRLLAHSDPETRMARAFEIADHLNAGRDELEPADKHLALEMNLLAGKRALASGAAVTAARYLHAARECFADELWQSQPALSLDLFMQSAESAIQTRDFNGALELLDGVEAQPLERMAAAGAAAKRITAEAMRRPMEEVVPLLLETLARFGVRWPARPGWLHTRWLVWRTDLALRGIYERGFRPLSGDSSWLPPAVIMAAGGPALSVASPELTCFFLAFLLRAYLRHGYAGSPSMALAAYASARLAFSDTIEKSRRFADAAHVWNQGHPSPVASPRTEYVLQSFLQPWLRSRRSVLEPLRVVSERLFELGDVEYGFYALAHRAGLRAVLGESLETVQREHEALAERTNISAALPEKLKARALGLLRSGPPAGTSLDEEIASIDTELRACKAARMGGWGVWAMVLTVLGRFERVLRCTEDGRNGASYAMDLYFYRGLAAAALSVSARWKQAWQYRRILRDALHQVDKLARLSPERLHTHLGLRAERARLQGRTRQALLLYTRAADEAFQHGYRHHAALLHERRAGFLASLRRGTEAAVARSRAAALYEEWNASLKVAELRNETTERTAAAFSALPARGANA